MILIKSFTKLSILTKLIIALIVIGIIISSVVVPVMLTGGSGSSSSVSITLPTTTLPSTTLPTTTTIPSTTSATNTTVSITIAPTIPPTQAIVSKTQLGIPIPTIPANVCWIRNDGTNFVNNQDHIFTMIRPPYNSKADSAYTGSSTNEQGNRWKWDYTGSDLYIVLDESFLNKTIYKDYEITRMTKNINGINVLVADKIYMIQNAEYFWKLSNC